MCEISIIIPIYNVENYIKDCLESVIHSRLFDICEVILIDDGSPDRSAEIAQAIADKYPNIRIYHYTNSGLSAARNRGMEHAKGKYLFFLDSDDYLCPDYLYILYQEAEKYKAEIVFAGYSRVDSNGQHERQIHRSVLEQFQQIDGCQYLNLRMNLGDWHNEVWCALYQRKFLETYDLKFDVNIKLYEDILFSNNVLLYARNVRAVSAYGYMYRYHTQSMVQNGVKKQDIIESLQVLDRFVEIYQELSPEKQKILGRVFFQHISMILYYIGQTTDDGKKYYKILNSKNILEILKNSITSPKERLKYFIFRYCIWLYYPLVKKKE